MDVVPYAEQQLASVCTLELQLACFDGFDDDVDLAEEPSSCSGRTGVQHAMDTDSEGSEWDIPLSLLQLRLTKQQRQQLDEDSSDDELDGDSETESSENDDTDCSWDSSDEDSTESVHEDAVESSEAHPFDCGCQRCSLKQYQCTACEGYFQLHDVRSWGAAGQGGPQWLCGECWDTVQPSMPLMLALLTDDTTVCNAIAGPLIGDQADDSDVSDLVDDEDLCVYCESEPTREDLGEYCSRKCMRKHGAELKRAKKAHSMLKALDTDLMFPSDVQAKRKEEGRTSMVIEELDHTRNKFACVHFIGPHGCGLTQNASARMHFCHLD